VPAEQDVMPAGVEVGQQPRPLGPDLAAARARIVVGVDLGDFPAATVGKFLALGSLAGNSQCLAALVERLPHVDRCPHIWKGTT